jgi:DNA modification methylase
MASQESLLSLLGIHEVQQHYRKELKGDARILSDLIDLDNKSRSHIVLPDRCVDLVVTSPPYWKKRDYGFDGQIGKEDSPEEYVAAIITAMSEWRRVLRPSGSVFLNIGDTYWKKSLQGIPSMIEESARKNGWIVRNRIIWVKKGGMPDPVKDRLANRHEYIIHFVIKDGYYYDLFGYADLYSADKRGANPGDVWEIDVERGMGGHLAPFPMEIVRRAITLACPREVCSNCGKPRKRIIERTYELDLTRPQAKRALEIANNNNLTIEHLAAIRATGISDAGKARQVQIGTDRNSDKVKALAKEAKSVLGGYFREFTFAKRKSVGWTDCGCGCPFMPGVVLDPFMGTGTTLDVAIQMKRSAIGIDLDPGHVENMT